jgi:hypothetical protein
LSSILTAITQQGARQLQETAKPIWYPVVGLISRPLVSHRTERVYVVNIQCLVFSKRLRLTALIALLAGCGGPVRDDDARIGGLIHQCFATVKESLFVSANCQGIDGWSNCDTVKALRPEPLPSGVTRLHPPTLEAYRENPTYWSEQINSEPYRFLSTRPDRWIIYGGLPMGTQLEIVQIARWSNGENGTYWIGHAVIQDGEFKGRRILLPWGDYGWIDAEYDVQARATKPVPKVDSRYLRECNPK